MRYPNDDNLVFVTCNLDGGTIYERDTAEESFVTDATVMSTDKIVVTLFPYWTDVVWWRLVNISWLWWEKSLCIPHTYHLSKSQPTYKYGVYDFRGVLYTGSNASN